MRNELTVFENEKFGKVRVVAENEKPYFNLNDVCEILGLKNPRQVKSRLNPKGVILVDTLTSGGKQQMNFINESNLYKCIFQSDKPEAEEITEWVTGEVLPAIRKTGMYMTDDVWNSIMNEPEKIGELLINYGKVRQENENLIVKNKIQEQEILELKPKATYYDLILQNPRLLATRIIASDYGMTPNAFNKLLHKNGIQYKQGSVWFLYSKYIGYGYTQTKMQPIVRTGGVPDSVPHMYWTQKGRIFLYDFLKSKGILPVIEQDEMGA